MDVLRRAFESLGFSGVATFLGSGNVVFETSAKDLGMLEKRVECGLRQALGYRVPVFIRTPAEVRGIATFKAFEKSAVRGADFNVILFKKTLGSRSRATLVALKTETDGFRIHGREIYWWRRKRPNTLLFSTVPLEKTLGAPFTVRSMSTIKRLIAKWP
jgi:uncharacterized protein (DUF1697 family)